MITTRTASRAEARYTSGSLTRNVLDLSWPNTLSMALSSIPMTLDGVWMGRLGAEALAASGIGMTLRLTMISPLMALSAAAGAVVARYIGASDQDRANSAVLQAVILFALTAGSIGLLGLAFAKPLLELSGATGALLPEAERYVRVLFYGLIAMEMVPSAGSMLVAAGSPELSLRVYLLVSVLTFILEPILVLGIGHWPGLGIVGGSLAMVLGNVVGVAYSFYLLLTRQAAAWIDVHHLRLDWPMMWRIVRIALPAVIQRGTPNLANSILMRIISGFGTIPLAAFNLVGKLLTFSTIPALGIARGAAALVGQNLGARKPERAARGAHYIGWASLATAIVFVGLSVALGRPLLGLFTTDAGVITEGMAALAVLGLGSILFSVSQVYENSLNGAGDTVSPMVINIIFFWVIQLPLVYVLSQNLSLGAQGIWWAIAISRLASAGLTFGRFGQGYWKRHEI